MSKFLKALEEAAREHAAQEQARAQGEVASGAPVGAVAPDETSLRVARWIEEGQELLRCLPRLLAECDRFRARAEAAEGECERLRQETADASRNLTRVLNDTLQPLSEIVARLRQTDRRGPSDR